MDRIANARLIERITQDYFTNTDRQIHLQTGDVLMEQDEHNSRLYYIWSGSFSGTIRYENELGEEEQLELFRAVEGDFLGVYSLFSSSRAAATRVTCLEPAVLAWIDRTTPAINEAEYGNLREQLIPIVLEELSHRQKRLSKAAHEREVAVGRLHIAEKLSTIGQLSTGIAHELNNALGVLERTAGHLTSTLENLLRQHEPEHVRWFELGLEKGQTVGSSVVRQRAKVFTERFGLDAELAKNLARSTDPDTMTALPNDVATCISLWETGRDCHDMQLAAKHSASIVRSVKELAGADKVYQGNVDLNTTLSEALSLLQSDLRQVTVEKNLAADLPSVWGNSSEFVQVWVNIIKNASDALKESNTQNPLIVISSNLHSKRALEICLTNNGPPIPENLLPRLFLPNITTKKGVGSSMGLGLGLCITKRIIDSYHGEISVKSDTNGTSFCVILPLTSTP